MSEAGWQPWPGGAAAGAGHRSPPGQQPGSAADPGRYTGPPPTGRYGAPQFVPSGAPPLPAYGPQRYGASGPGNPYAVQPAGRARPTTPPGAPPYDVPQPYLLLMRARDWAWWRPVLGLLLFTVLYLVAVLVLVVVAAVTGVAPDLALDDLTDPLVLLVTNASLIVAIPIVWLCWVVPHGMGTGWSSSVLGRLRWRLLGPYTLQALLTLGLAIGLTVVLTVATSGVEVTGPDASFVWVLLVVLLTTPLQAAAEEYVFRGYLSQTIAGWIGRPTAGAVVSGVLTAALFSLAHLPPDFLTFLDRFAIGLAFSAVVWLTGGLEAAIVLHAVNNMVIFVLVGLLGDEVLAVDASSGSNALLDWGTVLLGLLAMGAFVHWVARSRGRLRPELLSPAVDLRGALPAGGPFRAPAGPAWSPSGPPPWGPPGPAWTPPPPWVPPAPRWSPPPDERWARPAAEPPPAGGHPRPDQGGHLGPAPAGDR
jgi:membrane protease YdiL (CAAX protease family)